MKGPKLGPLKQRFEMVSLIDIHERLIKSRWCKLFCFSFMQIQTNYEDMIGKNGGNCLFEQRKYFEKIMDSWKPDRGDKSKVKPRGDSLPNINNCDVVSVFEENIQRKSIKEKHRLEHLNRKFAQCYMQSAWKDFAFINGLKLNKVLVKSKQNEKSFDIIEREIDDCVETTTKMIVSALEWW